MKIKTIKKYAAIGVELRSGPHSTHFPSTAVYIMSGHPSRVLIMNRVSIAFGTESKLAS